MNAQVLTVEELIGYLNEIVEAYVYPPRPDAPYPDNPPTEVAIIR